MEFENLDSITPIEHYKDILLKRDDKFIIGEVNGGKLRQSIYLIKSNYKKIVEEHNSTVVCSVNLKSPQSAITSTVCKLFNLNCNIISYKTKLPNINLSIAQENGAHIYGFKTGHLNVLDIYVKKYFYNNFCINMGFSSKDVVGININQVKNIPENLDYLVIPVGSAMNFIDILKGIVKFKKNPKKIIGVYVGGTLRTINKNIKNYLDVDIDYELIKYEKPYSTEVHIDNTFFDPIYEAKAYDWLLKNIDTQKNKVLLWVVGKRNLTFKPEIIKYLYLKENITSLLNF